MIKRLLLLFGVCQANLNNSLWGWNNHHGFLENLPRPRQIVGILNSACGNGQHASEYGFACPHMMMFSADMLLASKYDGNQNNFYYAVAGGSSDDDCGSCYQVMPLDAEQLWTPNFKQIIVQVVNSGFDVMQGQYDIFMGSGGFGWYTACNSDCSSNYCKGGSCLQNMYAGNFDQWNNAKYYDSNLCYSGGIKWLNETTSSMCKALSNGQTNLKDRILYDSCMLSNHMLYHQNFVSTDSVRVQCPKGLYMATGLRRADDAQYPKAYLGNKLTTHCRGNRNSGQYCITTMQDCCEFSCSWLGKGNPDPKWPRADICTQNGQIFNYY
jgi:hypothetical protein